MDQFLVQIESVSKRFGDLLANREVSIAFPAGCVLGLLGENGAGKTTVMNILCGLYLPDRGRILVDGQPLKLGSPRSSFDAGIGMVHQQFKLIEPLSGFENISLAMDRGRFLNAGRPREDVSVLNRELGFDLNLEMAVWQMTLAMRQQLEILRVLASGARVLILDEPTSVLSSLESQKLFAIVRKIAASGRSVVLVSHKLAEVLAVASRLVVMRQGEVVHAGVAQGIEVSALARLIVGEREIRSGARTTRKPGDVVLEVRNIEALSDRNLPAVRSVSFEVRAGELVGLLGVTGNGQNELMEAIAGLRPIQSGSIRAPRDPYGRGFGYVPAKHLGVGIAPGLTIADNALLGQQGRPAYRRWLDRRAMTGHAERIMLSFGVKARPESVASRLSGGNLQRLVLGRELEPDPPLILADYPTRGLDVAAAAEIRARLVDRAEAGAAVLMSSEELDETLAIADRVMVMHRGEVVAMRDPRALSMDELGRLMTLGGV
ncbi:MAG: ABC transporter ATP-binding protein [Parvibaculaceae bacterium]